MIDINAVTVKTMKRASGSVVENSALRNHYFDNHSNDEPLL